TSFVDTSRPIVVTAATRICLSRKKASYERSISFYCSVCVLGLRRREIGAPLFQGGFQFGTRYKGSLLEHLEGSREVRGGLGLVRIDLTCGMRPALLLLGKVYRVRRVCLRNRGRAKCIGDDGGSVGVGRGFHGCLPLFTSCFEFFQRLQKTGV